MSINWNIVEWCGKKPEYIIFFEKIIYVFKTLLSCNFPIQHNSATGLYLDSWDLSPFLKIGITSTSFHAYNKTKKIYQMIYSSKYRGV